MHSNDTQMTRNIVVLSFCHSLKQCTLQHAQVNAVCNSSLVVNLELQTVVCKQPRADRHMI